MAQGEKGNGKSYKGIFFTWCVPGLVLVLVQDRGGRPGLAVAISALWLGFALLVAAILLGPVSRIVRGSSVNR